LNSSNGKSLFIKGERKVLIL
jgi:hypothetical protein